MAGFKEARRHEKNVALEYIGNRLAKAREKHLLSITESPLSQKSIIESFENDMEKVSKHLEETGYGFMINKPKVKEKTKKTKSFN